MTDPIRFAVATIVATFPIGALRATARWFLDHDARVAFMAGGVERRGALRFARPDPSCLGLVPRALYGRDDSLLGAVARSFEALGVAIGDPRPFLGDVVPAVGRIAGPPLDDSARSDLAVAFSEARRVGRSGRGQSAIAYRGRAAGVEERDGTDALLARAPGPGAVLAKATASGQDERFDLPAIGPSTIRIARAVRLVGIGIEAGRSLVLSRPRVVELCEAYAIPLVGMEERAIAKPEVESSSRRPEEAEGRLEGRRRPSEEC